MNPVAMGSRDPISGNPAQSEWGMQASHPTGVTGLTPEEVQAKCIDLVELYRKDRFVYAIATPFLLDIITSNISRDATSDLYTQSTKGTSTSLMKPNERKRKLLDQDPDEDELLSLIQYLNTPKSRCKKQSLEGKTVKRLLSKERRENARNITTKDNDQA
jgi:hypothetical protein